eukprot:3958399-Amphidinium_carterae.3
MDMKATAVFKGSAFASAEQRSAMQRNGYVLSNDNYEDDVLKLAKVTLRFVAGSIPKTPKELKITGMTSQRLNSPRKNITTTKNRQQ